MPKTPENEQFSEEEATKRMENAVRKALNTPRKPHLAPGKKNKNIKKPQKPR